MTVDPFLTLAAQHCLAVLFLAAAWHKLSRWQGFSATIRAYEIVPIGWTAIVAVVLLAAELSICVGLLLESLRIAAAIGAASLLAMYLAAMASAIARGRRQIECGCAFWAEQMPLSWQHLVRNAVLIALAIVAGLTPIERRITGLDIAQLIAAVLTLGLIYLSVESLLANRPYARRGER